MVDYADSSIIPLMTDWTDKTIGKVRVEQLLGRGGMAEVYRGMHITLGRPVAVKVLLSHLEARPELQARFEREARVLANLRHPNILQIYDFDFVDGQPYIVMEYINGPTLSDHLHAVHAVNGRLSLTEIGRILVMLSSALDYAHAQGVIHRDIKPGNIMIQTKGVPFVPGQPFGGDAEPILTDFGLTRLTDASSQSVSGTIAGTPAYMSPEQARGDRADHRSDLYSLGVVLYEMLSGRVPFEADTTMGVLMKHLQQSPPPLDSLPISLQLIIEKSLAKDPGQRYQSARELVEDYLNATGLTVADVAPGYTLTASFSSHPSTTAPALSDRVTLPPSPIPAPALPDQPSALRNRSTLWMGLTGLLLVILLFTIFFPGQIFSPTAVANPTQADALPLTAYAGAPTEMPMPASTDNSLNSSDDGEIKTFGVLRFYDVAAYLDEVVLNASEMQPAPAGFQYEAWLVGGESRRSLGILAIDAQGHGQLTFIDDQGRNLLSRYDRLEITLEPTPDNSPNPSDTVAFSSGIPDMSLMHERHLFVSFSETPGNRPLLIGMMDDVRHVDEHARAMLDAYQKKDASEVSRHVEAINNLLVGKQGQGYGDLNKDGVITDPGDGYGLLLNGDSSGYLEGTISHTQYAAEADEATVNIKLHGGHVVVSIRNVESWAAELRNLLTQILADPLGESSNALIRQVASLADRMLNGRDLNGNERVEPIPNEGGAMTALEHAGYMIDMPILQGANRMPPPAPADGTPPAEPPGYGP